MEINNEYQMNLPDFEGHSVVEINKEKNKQWETEHTREEKNSSHEIILIFQWCMHEWMPNGL